jgi:hypothetical protein
MWFLLVATNLLLTEHVKDLELSKPKLKEKRREEERKTNMKRPKNEPSKCA